MMANGNVAPPDAQYAALQQRVTGIEHSISGLSAQISTLATKLDERGKTPWATIIAAMGVVLAIVVAGGQLAKAPLDQSISRLERDASELRAGIVPRGEHERVWSNYDDRVADLQRQMDESKAALGNTYSLRDYIQRLTERIDTLEERTLSQSDRP